MSSAADLDLARRLADLADAVTRARFRAHDLHVTSKPDRTPVTDADTAVEDAIRTLLAQERPDDAILGEERGGTEATNARTWVIDPIDGTKNFLRGLPIWATLIALVVDGTPQVGVISAAALGRRWWAATGHGAWTSEADGTQRPISVSGVDELGNAYLSTTHLGSWTEHHSRSAYLRLVDACWENRAFGDFWQHVLVAEGAIDLAAEAVVNAWDVAAVQVIVEEAGGRFSDLTGAGDHTLGSALSSNGLLHESALDQLRSG
ncbi:histidinol-phosphatase [Actinoalloteichus hymeniacidonis]|uniref:Histidinol-phosphatase n=1 Tax=Actinoalloteichus hymeniacidonis TaxID=340345 RepID=A0AAC9HU27_9PSEU|nr:histidinol-phosphatase [Actinoalloteichus hymeniacidonis]AOS65493.1 histidinol-phosphatase, inositol monophosphatase family [Actinoalloteichus hymeniacidonis]MBB5906420.1 histidinol-phosphatase [Actinoalloteichus hymeniacidonis]